MRTSPSIDTLIKALHAFQSEVGNVGKDSRNPYFKSNYTSLPQLLDFLREPLVRHGFCVLQMPSNRSLTTRLMHTSGEWVESTGDLLMKEESPQALASAITYMRRYHLQSMLLIGSEDDDGNAATRPTQAKEEKAVDVGELLNKARKVIDKK